MGGVGECASSALLLDAVGGTGGNCSSNASTIDSSFPGRDLAVGGPSNGVGREG